MGTRKLKKEVFALLAEQHLDSLLTDLERFPAKEVVNVLFSAICQVDELVRWHAISAMGVMVAHLARQEMEEGRIMMRRLLWSLNDESGGIGWGAPESMAEIMHHHAGLAGEYIHMLISYTRPDGPELEQEGNYLEHESLQRGLLWGLDRLCDRRLDLLLEKGLVGDILAYLNSGDHVVRGLAVKICSRIGVDPPRKTLLKLMDDESNFVFYHGGEFFELQVRQLAGMGSLEQK